MITQIAIAFQGLVPKAAWIMSLKKPYLFPINSDFSETDP